MNQHPHSPHSPHHPPHLQGQEATPYTPYSPYAPGGQYPGYPQHAEELKHAGLGIASLVLAILAAMGLFVLFVIAGVMENNTPGGIDEDSPQAIIVGLFLILGVVLEFIALGLGLGSLLQPNRKKLMGILGIIGSLLSLFFFGVIMIAGALMQ